MSSTLNIPLSSLGRGAWTQAILEQSTCNPAINNGFFVFEVQAPLDPSTCTWLRQQFLELQAHPQMKLQRKYCHISNVIHSLAWGQHHKATPPETCAGCPPPPTAQRRPSCHTPQRMSAGCRGRPLSHANRNAPTSKALELLTAGHKEM